MPTVKPFFESIQLLRRAAARMIVLGYPLDRYELQLLDPVLNPRPS
jgi:hypothetical protein